MIYLLFIINFLLYIYIFFINRFGFEAAVCGGIPIIQTIQTSFSSDTITSVKGIMNGTTNFILSSMEKNLERGYEDILKEAQQLGYAEADPTADVEGYDVQAKIFILTYLSLGFKLNSPSDILTWGISSINSKDFLIASSFFNSTIRLLALSSITSQNIGGIFVAPFLVSKSSSAFSNVNGPDNMVQIKSSNLNLTTLSGPGAGRFPTAHSVLNDLQRISNNTVSINPLQCGVDEVYGEEIKQVEVLSDSLVFNYLVRFIQQDSNIAK